MHSDRLWRCSTGKLGWNCCHDHSFIWSSHKCDLFIQLSSKHRPFSFYHHASDGASPYNCTHRHNKERIHRNCSLLKCQYIQSSHDSWKVHSQHLRADQSWTNKNKWWILLIWVWRRDHILLDTYCRDLSISRNGWACFGSLDCSSTEESLKNIRKNEETFICYFLYDFVYCTCKVCLRDVFKIGSHLNNRSLSDHRLIG